ncbi:7SK snRNA methylphosphate capping enzyme [Anolis sagrei]|uniref:7SK snRNA methylphosphate capping enzyme n=1 Tax=Anolis sagrei TaxID=38937 RepID=UPI0035230533
MIEMAADKDAFRVPAPPPPLPKPPPKGPTTCGAGDLPRNAAGKGGPMAGKAQGSRGGGDGGLTDPQRGVEASVEEGDGLAELHKPRNGFQAPPQPQQQPQQRPNKRRNSCNVGGGGGFKHPAFKRRRRVNSECDPVLPSEFLLGGNIFDPLNLNSLLDEEVNQALNAETPKSSPLPAKGRDPVEILIPKDITDPLSLNNAQDDPPVLASPAKRKRHRHRGAQRGGSTDGAGTKAPATPAATASASCQKSKPCNGATPQPYELNTVINCRDEVVSPLLPAGHGEPQPSHQGVSAGGGVTPSCVSVASSASTGSRHHRKRRRTCSKSEVAAARHQGPSSALEQPSRSSPERARSAPRSRHAPPASARRQPRHKFQYGNYCKYYGYRNPDCEDARLRVMKPEWFQGKEVLDVGCNVGHFTLSVAKKWGPARMVGLDIDGHLIHSARQNIRHYLSEELHQQKQESDEGPSSTAARKTFPASLMASRGPIAAPRVPQEGTDASVFPNNVIFIKGNYVLERDELLEAQRPEYDVILCLSLTKWVHLNWGDEGLKRLFKRIYRHLRPGGILVLEPQAWSSYKKRKNLTETISRHFNRIKLKPDQFPSYLTSSEVGFCSYELVAMPRNTPKGFQRPIYLFHKTRPGGH